MVVQLASDGNGTSLRLNPKIVWSVMSFGLVHLVGVTAIIVRLMVQSEYQERVDTQMAAALEQLTEIHANHEDQGQHRVQAEVNKRYELLFERLGERLDKGGL